MSDVCLRSWCYLTARKKCKKRTQALFGWFLWFVMWPWRRQWQSDVVWGVFVYNSLFMQREDKHNDDYDSEYAFMGDH